MKKTELEKEIKKLILSFEKDSGFNVEWVKVIRPKSVGFTAPKKGISVSVKVKNT